MAQEKAFAQEIKTLQHHETLHTKDKVNKRHKLYPVLDDQGILRVGGCLSHSALHPEVKHPAILPRNSHVSTLLVKHHHEKVYHQGRGITMNALRANGFWIVGCSKSVSSYIYRCTRCRRLRRCTEQQKMSDLPKERMETTPPFIYSGMDCFGPFYIKEGRKELKRYGLLIKVGLFLMNTPASSHMGGVWERQIRTIRGILKSILDESDKQLDISSLRTFLYEVMAVINSRPLTTDQLCDPSSPEPLTPNHILTMKSTIISPPPGRFVKEDLYLRKRWRRVQFLANTFWTRWKREYLLNLSRQK